MVYEFVIYLSLVMYFRVGCNRGASVYKGVFSLYIVIYVRFSLYSVYSVDGRLAARIIYQSNLSSVLLHPPPTALDSSARQKPACTRSSAFHSVNEDCVDVEDDTVSV